MKKRISCLLLALLVMALSLSMAGCNKKSGGEVARDARSSVARVATEVLYGVAPNGGDVLATGSGSAFAVGLPGEEPEYYVTNRHVVVHDVYALDADLNPYAIVATGVPSLSVWLLKGADARDPVEGLDHSQCIRAEVVYVSDGYPDIAVLRVSEPVPDRVPLPLLADSDELEPGAPVWALGYPANAYDFEAGTFGSKLLGGIDDVVITSGVASRTFQSSDETIGKQRVVQHDAKIQHGSSGGPLINEKGQVVGVNTWGTGQDTSSGDVNNYYSVCISEVIKILDDNDIDWYDGGSDNGWVLPVVIGGVALVVIAGVVILIVVLNNKKKAEQARQEAERRRQQQAVQTAAAQQAAAAAAAQAAAQRQSSFPDGPRLQCLSGAFAGKRFSLSNSVRIGRDPNKNDLVFPSDTQGVSSVHAVLMVDNNTVWLKDLGSTYGTYIAGGRRLAANESVQLHMGDRFWLGSEKEMFVIAPKGGL